MVKLLPRTVIIKLIIVKGLILNLIVCLINRFEIRVIKEDL
jgi:hypothetical protein